MKEINQAAEKQKGETAKSLEHQFWVFYLEFVVEGKCKNLMLQNIQKISNEMQNSQYAHNCYRSISARQTEILRPGQTHEF